MKYGKTPIVNADKAKPQITYVFAGEQRTDRRPEGRVERWVDVVGNICNLQMSSTGDPNGFSTVERKRLQYRRDGFIEHAKCPLRSGAHTFTGPIASDFAQMPAHLRDACPEDPRVMTKSGGELHAGHACDHVEWLITHRRAATAAENAKRNANRVDTEAIIARRHELESLQLEELRAKVEKPTKRKGD